MGLSSIQTQLLRYFTLAKMQTVKDAVKALEAIVVSDEKDIQCNVNELTNQIDAINRVIKRYDLEIIEGLDEINGKKLFALVNTADNHVTQKAKFYERSTVQLFSKIVQACVMSENGKLSEIDCVNLNTLCEMTKTAAQNAIHRLVKDKWFLSEDGHVTLSMRSILELESSIKQQYPDHVKNCPLCKSFLIQGAICADCRCKIHFFCLKKFFEKSGGKKNKICPSCNASWNELDHADQNLTVSSVEENGNDFEVELDQNESQAAPAPVPTPAPAKRRKRIRSQKD